MVSKIKNIRIITLLKYIVFKELTMKKIKLLNFTPLIITSPSILLGVIAMYYNNVSTSIWIQNSIFFVIAVFISHFIVKNKSKMISNKLNCMYIVLSLVLLILTFISPSMNGVHRWLSLGIISLNISMIILPIMIVELWKLSKIKSLWITTLLTIFISVVLFVQPDASQLTGLSIPMLLILCNKTNNKGFRLFIIVIFSLLIIFSWIFIDSLQAVDYVENIVQLVANMGFIWLVFGIFSLILLLIPFIVFPPQKMKLPSVCVGLYFLIILVSTLFGNFPVPLMGYGISPIIGYFFAITWYTKAKINS